MKLDPEEIARLEEFIAKYREHKSRPPKENGTAIELCYKLGYIPPELIEQIGETEYTVTRGNGSEPESKITIFYDKAKSQWQDEMDQLKAEYGDCIAKARELTLEELQAASGDNAFWEPETEEILTEIQNTITVTQLRHVIRDYIAKQGPRIQDLHPAAVILPIDPVSRAKKLYEFLETESGKAYERNRLEKKPDASRKYTFLINSTKPGEPTSRAEADIIVTIQEKGPGFTPLDYYDREVLIAIGTLYKEAESLGTEKKLITVKQIYNAMDPKQGTQSREPDQGTKDKIDYSITKMRNIDITISNKNEEKRATNGKAAYPEIEITSTFLNADRIKATHRGQTSDYAYEILQFPVLTQIAESRGQIIKIPLEAYGLPRGASLTKTSAAYRKYLLDEIDKIKKGYRNNPKILYSSVFKAAGIDIENPQNKMTVTRQKAAIIKYMDHLKESGYIKTYTKTPDGVIIDKKPKRKAPKKGQK